MTTHNSSLRTGNAVTPDTAARVRQLTKKYGDRTVVNNVSFDIYRGETFALLGPNGAGKSTTVEILEGYRRSTSGEVTVLGAEPITAPRPWKAKLGIVLQSSGQAGMYTVREQLKQFARYYPNPRSVDDVIRAVGLESKANSRISKLSGGQQRRVDVAMGIIGNPELLFLDEPTTGFDPQARREFWSLIGQLQDEGTTIVLTTHYLDEAAHLADRVAVINQGSLQSIGPIAEFGTEQQRIPMVSWRENGQSHTERVTHPWTFAQQLAERLGGEPEDLEIRRPSLEEIYIDMVQSAAKKEKTS